MWVSTSDHVNIYYLGVSVYKVKQCITVNVVCSGTDWPLTVTNNTLTLINPL